MRAKIEANRRNSRCSTGPRTVAGKALVATNAIKHGIFAAVPVLTDEDPDAWEAHRAGVLESLGAVGTLELNLAERAALLFWRLARLARYEAAVVMADAEADGLPNGLTPLDEVLAPRKEQALAERLATLRKRARLTGDTAERLDEAVRLLSRLERQRRGEAVPMDQAFTLFEAAFNEVHDRGGKCVWCGDKGFLAAIGDGCGDMYSVEWTASAVHRAFAYYEGWQGWVAGRMLREVKKTLGRSAAAARCQSEEAEAESAGLETKGVRQRAASRAAAIVPGDGREAKIIRYETHLSRQLQMTLNQLERVQAARAGGFVPPPVAVEVGVTSDRPPVA